MLGRREAAEECYLLYPQVSLLKEELGVAYALQIEQPLKAGMAHILHNRAGSGNRECEVMRQVPGFQWTIVVVTYKRLNTRCHCVRWLIILRNLAFQHMNEAFGENRKHSYDATYFRLVVKPPPHPSEHIQYVDVVAVNGHSQLPEPIAAVHNVEWMACPFHPSVELEHAVFHTVLTLFLPAHCGKGLAMRHPALPKLAEFLVASQQMHRVMERNTTVKRLLEIK